MNIALTTTVLVLSIMLYGFFLEALTGICFVKSLKKIGYGTVAVYGCLPAVCSCMPSCPR